MKGVVWAVLCAVLAIQLAMDLAWIYWGIHGLWRMAMDLALLAATAGALAHWSSREYRRREAAEQEKGRGDDLVQTILENSADMLFIVSPEGTYLYHSPSVEAVLGYKPGELVGRSIADLLHPEDVPKVRQAIAEGQAKPGAVRSREVRMRHKDGSWRQIEGVGKFVPETDGPGKHVVTLREIGGRRRAEDEIRKLSRLIEQSPVLIIITDAKGNIEYVNPKFCQLTGYAAEEVVGRNPRFLKSGETSPEEYKKLWETLASGGEWRGMLRNKKKNGELYWVSAHISPIRDAQGRITHFGGIQEDVTEKKSLEAQFQQAQKMESVGRLAGGVAHDFNNLLTAILGYSEMLVKSFEPGDPRRVDAEEIRTTGRRAADLTRQLLAFSRRQVIEPRLIGLNSLILSMDKILRRLIGEDIELVILPEAESDIVRADPGQIEQVLVNLAVNARDAMPKGGTLKIETVNANLGVDFVARHPGTTPGPTVMIAVSDTGTGMTEEVKSHIFEPFFTTKGQGKGTGLGLATCYGIVKQSGGDIYVFSAPERGSTFKIFLPQARGRAEELTHHSWLGALPRGTETILLAEDETSVRTMVIRVLARQGYNVLVADTGEDALRVAREHGLRRIGLLMTDVVMPQMGGIELFLKLRAERPDLRTIITSGYTGAMASNGGALPPQTTFLPKPFTPAALAFAVREVLDQRSV